MKSTITYGIANDPKDDGITLLSVGVFYLIPKAKVEGELCLDRFETYVDIGPVFWENG
jgi:hypothetical protein